MLDDTSEVTILTNEPTVEVLAEMKLDHEGVMAMAEWVKRYRPHCVPTNGFIGVLDLVPHDGFEPTSSATARLVTDNELLAELAGRKCYDSFADAGAKRTNGEYLASMWAPPPGRVPHRSTGYHPKMTFFFGDVSRRVSHELIRNYVGADRDEEGSPSQESTRFTHHPGVYICPPRDISTDTRVQEFRGAAQENYDRYCRYIRVEAGRFEAENGRAPKGMDRKRIYEAASHYLMHSCSTSWIWTTNPMALAKLFAERCDAAADLEFQRFANKLKRICLERWLNLFPQVER